MLQRVALLLKQLEPINIYTCVAVCCSALQCVAAYCSLCQQLTPPTTAAYQRLQLQTQAVIVFVNVDHRIWNVIVSSICRCKCSLSYLQR